MSDRHTAEYSVYHQGASGNRPGASRVDVRAVGFIGALLVLTGLCGILYVGQATRVYVLRREVQVARRERAAFYRRNASLRSEIARAGASENLSTWAVELGYGVVGEPHYVAFSYAPLPGQDTTEESLVSEEKLTLPDGKEEKGIAARLSRWGQDMLNQFREWIDLAAIKADEAQ